MMEIIEKSRPSGARAPRVRPPFGTSRLRYVHVNRGRDSHPDAASGDARVGRSSCTTLCPWRPYTRRIVSLVESSSIPAACRHEVLVCCLPSLSHLFLPAELLLSLSDEFTSEFAQLLLCGICDCRRPSQRIEVVVTPHLTT